MKNLKCILLTLVLVIAFVSCMVLTASAEEDVSDGTEPDPSYDESYDITEEPYDDSSWTELSDESSEPSEESYEESPDVSYYESSSESSAEISDESSEPSVSYPESSAESYPESSAEISQYSGQDSSEPYSEPEISYPEQSAQISAEPSLPESSVPQESTSKPESSQLVSDAHTSTPEPSEPQISFPEIPDEPIWQESDFVMLDSPRKDPLNWLAGIGTVIPVQKESSDDESSFDPGHSPQEQSYEELSFDISFEAEVSGVKVSPITETVADTLPGAPFNRTRAFLIGIIIFSLIGMGVTFTLIVILRRSGFIPTNRRRRNRTAV